jgi:hypothetical protein
LCGFKVELELQGIEFSIASAARLSAARSMPDPAPPRLYPSRRSLSSRGELRPHPLWRWLVSCASLVQLQARNILEVSPVFRNEGQTMLEGRSGDDEVQCA